MIDIHAHILPGFDDGARNLAEAVEMACQARQDGIEAIVATPHILDPTVPHRARILAAVAALQERLDAEGIPMRILPGAEIHVGPDVAGMVAQGQAMTLCDGGRYLLLELPQNELPNYTGQVVFDLLTLGVTPIIAHPERNRDLARNPSQLEALVRRGCLTQISTGSVRGRFGPEARKAAEFYLAHGLAHLMATDGHGTYRRRVMMAEAHARVAASYGDQAAVDLTHNAPAAVIEGRAYEPPPAHPPRNGWARWALKPAIGTLLK